MIIREEEKAATCSGAFTSAKDLLIVHVDVERFDDAILREAIHIKDYVEKFLILTLDITLNGYPQRFLLFTNIGSGIHTDIILIFLLLLFVILSPLLLQWRSRLV